MRKLLLVSVLAFTLFSCDTLSSDDCDEYNVIVERYDNLIQIARDNNDSVQVLLLIEERNDKLEDLDC